VEEEIFWVCIGSKQAHRVNIGVAGIGIEVRILDDYDRIFFKVCLESGVMPIDST
jgi:hypothetical protein